MPDPSLKGDAEVGSRGTGHRTQGTGHRYYKIEAMVEAQGFAPQ